MNSFIVLSNRNKLHEKISIFIYNSIQLFGVVERIGDLIKRQLPVIICVKNYNWILGSVGVIIFAITTSFCYNR